MGDQARDGVDWSHAMPAETVSDEISHLMRQGPSRGPRKGKPYGQKQAVAAALNMKRAGKIKGGGRVKKRKSKRGGRRY